MKTTMLQMHKQIVAQYIYNIISVPMKKYVTPWVNRTECKNISYNIIQSTQAKDKCIKNSLYYIHQSHKFLKYLLLFIT